MGLVMRTAQPPSGLPAAMRPIRPASATTDEEERADDAAISRRRCGEERDGLMRIAWTSVRMNAQDAVGEPGPPRRGIRHFPDDQRGDGPDAATARQCEDFAEEEDAEARAHGRDGTPRKRHTMILLIIPRTAPAPPASAPSTVSR